MYIAVYENQCWERCSMKNDMKYSTGKMSYTYFMLAFVKSDQFCKGHSCYSPLFSLYVSD